MHQKHAKLTKPQLGNFHRTEWAMLGAPCDRIQQLSEQIAKKLKGHCKIGYVDADHASGDAPKPSLPYQLSYTDKIHHHRFDIQAQFESYQFRQWFNDQDMVLVNGNHFKANRQIVILDPRKKASLERKLDRLTDVRLIITTENNQETYPFLQAHLPNPQSITTISINHIDSIVQFLLNDWKANQPELYGLVLAGGKSQRMGEDKGTINYHGKAQREYMAEQLNEFCSQTYISCSSINGFDPPSNFELLSDKLIGLGPFGAILSAFQFDPNKAWLVVACDLPLLDRPTLTQLVQHRNPSKIATTFNSPINEFPEPLITIWEPKSYQHLLLFLNQGYSCPRKVLINSEIELLTAKSPEALKNVNTPEERQEVRRVLEKGVRGRE